MPQMPLVRGCEPYIISTVAMTTLSKVLMERWIKDHTRAELEEMAQELELRIKNATIDGLPYGQQEALVRKSLEQVNRVLDEYRKQLRDKS